MVATNAWQLQLIYSLIGMNSLLKLKLLALMNAGAVVLFSTKQLTIALIATRNVRAGKSAHRLMEKTAIF
jgi:hypothetical protein